MCLKSLVSTLSPPASCSGLGARESPVAEPRARICPCPWTASYLPVPGRGSSEGSERLLLGRGRGGEAPEVPYRAAL